MMRKLRLPALLALLLAVLVVIPTSAASQPSGDPPVQPANYCLACHTSDDTRLANVTAWGGGIEHNLVSPCPAVVKIKEELYYTERILLAIERARQQAPAGADLTSTDARMSAAWDNYQRLLDAPVTSLEAFNAEASLVRYRLGKVYTAVNQTIETAKRARVLWVGVGVSLLLVAFLVWGWLNARKALKTPYTAPQKSFRFYFPRAMFLALVFSLFSLPIFRLPSQAVVMSTAEEQERQAVLDEAGRAALTADRELGRAWALAQIGVTWAQKDPSQAQVVLEEAWSAAQQAPKNAAALWGFSQNAWEAGGAEDAKLAQAALVAADLDATRARTWGLRLVAESWLELDAARATEIFENSQALTAAAVEPYNQYDLRALAVSWARIDPQAGIRLANQIHDPALRSWALREIAGIAGDETLYETAVEGARRVSDPLQQARLLREVALLSGDAALFGEAAQALQATKGTEQAYALADLAAASGDPALVEKISSDYPAAQALAYFHLADYENAWQAANRIVDPFEQAQAQAAIAGAWGDAGAAAQIVYSPLRARALRDISLKTGNTALVEEMENRYDQVQALAAAGLFQEAWQRADGLQEGYPLVALGAAWAAVNPQSAVQVLESLSREVDKAVVLRAIAVASAQDADFERALGMALAARVSGDPLSPVQASLALADAFAFDPAKWEAALWQAYDAAHKITIIY